MLDPNKVVVVGAGPVGLMTACLVKAQNPGINIVVLDKRIEGVRKHSLRIRPETTNVVLKLLKSIPGEHSQAVKNLEGRLFTWRGKHVKTNAIEIALGRIAIEMGIIVERGDGCGFSEPGVDSPLSASSTEPPSQRGSEDRWKRMWKKLTKKDPDPSSCCKDERLKLIYQGLPERHQNARFVIGADGATSVIRRTLGIRKVDQGNAGYAVEFKFALEGSSKSQTKFSAVTTAMKTGFVGVEFLSDTAGSTKKSDDMLRYGTYRILVDRETYEKIRDENQKNEIGAVKGTYANPWFVAELEDGSDPTIQKLNRCFKIYASSLHRRNGKAKNVRITAVSFDYYRAEKVVVSNGDHTLFLVGDASAGAVFERGLSKGFREAVLCARTVANQIKDERQAGQAIHSEDRYDVFSSKMKRVFVNARNASNVKACVARVTGKIVKATSVVFRMFNDLRSTLKI